MLTPLVMQNAPLMMDKQANIGAAGPQINGSHLIYDFNDAQFRHDQTTIARASTVATNIDLLGLYKLTLNPSATGDTFYLPYGWDEIHSVKLPARPDLGTTGITTVTTANLSGCCIYIEKKHLTNDIIFYHANSVRNSPSALSSATQPAFQTGGALRHLGQLHTLGAADYAGHVTGGTALSKIQYNARVPRLMTSEASNKVHKGKTMSFAAGTTVAGFFRSGAWEFWFQTWARVEHYYVNAMSKAAMKSKSKYGAFQVVECRKFYP